MNVYEIITQQIMERLQKGEIPWHKPWAGGEPPRNLVSKKPYRGINVWLLESSKYESNYWLSYKQANDLGGNVRKGEKSTIVVFWKMYEHEENTDEGELEHRTVPLLRYYRVFNLEQCENIPEDKIPRPETPTLDFNPIDECERIISAMPKRPEIKSAEPRAYYNARLDYVNMPRKELFNTEAHYYATLFHELSHATGHAQRLNRKTVTEATYYGSPTYTREELCAEMSAAYLCGHAGIENNIIDNAAAYIQGWLKHLKSDPKAVVMAAAQGQRAADYVLGVNPQDNKESEV